MVRTPCCDKNGLKKGTWTPEEDKKLIAYVTRYGCWNWRQLPKFAGLQRCGKSCRLRWMNYLRPNIKRGNYTDEEEEIIIRMHKSLGNRWSAIAEKLPGRTDNEIKNYWHTHLKKRVDQEPTKTTHEQETISDDIITQHETTQIERLQANVTDSLNQDGTLFSSEMPLPSPQSSTSDFSLATSDTMAATSDTMATTSIETECTTFSQLNHAKSVSSMEDLLYNDGFTLLEAYGPPNSEDFWSDLVLGDSYYMTNEIWEPSVDFDIPILEGELLFS